MRVLVLIVGHFGLAEVELVESWLCPYVSLDLSYSTSAYFGICTGRKIFLVKRVSRGGAERAS